MPNHETKRARVHIDASALKAVDEETAVAASEEGLSSASDTALLAELKRRNINLSHEIISHTTVAADYAIGPKLGEGEGAAVFDALQRSGEHRHLALKRISLGGAETGDAQSKGFLADALTTVAIAKAQSGDMANVDALLIEAVPARRAVYEANMGDANARLAFVNALNSTGNIVLQTADKPTAQPYFEEAATVAEEGYEADSTNAALGNAYLTAAIGMNNATSDPEWYAKVKSIATALNTAGTLDPALAPVVQPLLGS